MANGNLDTLKQRGKADENMWAYREEVTSLERLKYQLDEQI